jgi:hypothetical protein
VTVAGQPTLNPLGQTLSKMYGWMLTVAPDAALVFLRVNVGLAVFPCCKSTEAFTAVRENGEDEAAATTSE